MSEGKVTGGDIYVSPDELFADGPPSEELSEDFIEYLNERSDAAPRRGPSQATTFWVVIAIVVVAFLGLVIWGETQRKDSFEGGQGYGWVHGDYLYGYAPQPPELCMSGPAAAWYACNARCAENPMGMSNTDCMGACLEARARGEELAASPPDGCVGGFCQA